MPSSHAATMSTIAAPPPAALTAQEAKLRAHERQIELFRDTLKPVSAALGALFIFLGIWDASRFLGANPGLFGAYEALVGLAFVGMYLVVRQRPIKATTTHVFGFLIGALPTSVIALSMHLKAGDPREALNLALVVLGTGYVIYETKVLAAVYAGVIATWTSAMAMYPPGPDPSFYAMGLVSAFAIGALVHHARRRSTRRLIELQVELEHAKDRAERDVVLLRDAETWRNLYHATTTHELKNPLTTIRTITQTLDQHGSALDETKRAELTTLLDKSVRDLSQLVDDSMDVARLHTGKLKLDIAPTEIGTVIHELVDEFQASAKAAEIKLEARIEPALSLDADATRIRQVLRNLLTNAVKFTPANGWIRVEARHTLVDEPIPIETPLAPEDHIVIRVQDSGQGLGADELEDLFEPFVQARSESDRPAQASEGDTIRAARGTGLGLYISQGIVRAHGGDLIATSMGHGRGTTFTAYLPVQLDRAALDAAGEPLTFDPRSPIPLGTPSRLAPYHRADGQPAPPPDPRADAASLFSSRTP